jgi:cyclase
MLKRVIPLLLVERGELIKTVRFGNPRYIGDLLNTVKIYNKLEVDELCILDRSASTHGINFDMIAEFASESFVPVTYGGGIESVEQVRRILRMGVEKVILSRKLSDTALLKKLVTEFGSSTIAACIDYKHLGNQRIVHSSSGRVNVKMEALELAKQLSDIGVGEIIMQAIDRDGTYNGLDAEIIQELCSTSSSPIVVAGGCADLRNAAEALSMGASGVAVGSLFVFYTRAKGILINYPSSAEFEEAQIPR